MNLVVASERPRRIIKRSVASSIGLLMSNRHEFFG